MRLPDLVHCGIKDYVAKAMTFSNLNSAVPQRHRENKVLQYYIKEYLSEHCSKKYTAEEIANSIGQSLNFPYLSEVRANVLLKTLVDNGDARRVVDRRIMYFSCF